MANDNDGLLKGLITDESIELMRKRIGYPNPTLRSGITRLPWNTTASADAIRQYAWSLGDDNPMYMDPAYGRDTRWGVQIAPPGFEMSMGYNCSKQIPEALDRETHKALRGVQLFHSGGEDFYYRPMRVGDSLYRSEWVAGVELKESEFAGRSAIVTNGRAFWNQDNETVVNGVNWFVHAERRKASKDASKDKYAKDEPAHYTDEQMAEIEAGYDNEFVRGADTWYFEDVTVGEKLPRMVKGPFTVTDMINLHMGAGWLTYGNPPYRLAYENRKKLRGFYSKNVNGAWDTVQRVHWENELATQVGVQQTYDIGPVRHTMLCHYLSNIAGDDGFVHRIRFEFRRFNYVGDITWIEGTITAARVDDVLGPLVEIDLSGVNQRGHENIRGSATVLLASRKLGPVTLPKAPPLPQYRAETPIVDYRYK